MSADTTTSVPQAGTAPRRRGGNGPFRVWLWLPPLLVLGAVIAVWFAVSASLGSRSFILPTPDRILGVFLREDTRNEIFAGMGVTIQTMLAGLLAASVIGIVWAIAMSQAKWIERSTYPYAVILQSIPILAITPIIAFWAPDGFTARTIVCVLIALFPMVSNTYFGLQSVDRSHRELFKLQKATRWIVLTKLQLPAAQPAIFAGLRISAGLAVVGAVVGDFFFQQGVIGIGALLRKYQARLQMEELFAGVLLASLFGVAVFLIFGLIARLAVGKWYDFG
jgi:NitT/TauT family transport system permease protein